jgi:hypothetical protein
MNADARRCQTIKPISRKYTPTNANETKIKVDIP